MSGHTYQLKTQDGQVHNVKARTAYGTSTVAFGAYNMIAMVRGTRSFDEILASLRTNGLALVEREQLAEGMKTLLGRGYIREVEPGRFDVCDPKRRIVVRRDRTDCGIGRDGIPFGGWNSWLVRDPMGLRRLDEVIR